MGGASPPYPHSDDVNMNVINIDDLNPLLRHVAQNAVSWTGKNNEFKFITRKKWKAVSPYRKDYINLPIRNVIFIYSTDTNECITKEECRMELQQLQNFEIKKMGRFDIKYNFFIGGDGTVYEGRGWLVQGQAPHKYYTLDGKSINIAFLGDHRQSRSLRPGHRDSDNILPRKEWHAYPPKSTVKLKLPVSNVIISYHAGKQDCQFEAECKRVLRDLQRINFRNELTDVDHNFYVGGDGEVYEGRGWTIFAPPPAKYVGLTTQSLSVAYIGDYSIRNPTDRMITSTLRIIDLAIQKNVLTRNYDIATYRFDF